MRSSPFLFGWMPIRRMSPTVAVVKEYIERNTFLTIAVWMGDNSSNGSDGCRGEFRLYSRVLLFEGCLVFVAAYLSEARTVILTPRFTKVKRLFFHQDSFRVHRNVLTSRCQLPDVAEEHHVNDYVMTYLCRWYRVAVGSTAGRRCVHDLVVRLG